MAKVIKAIIRYKTLIACIFAVPTAQATCTLANAGGTWQLCSATGCPRLQDFTRRTIVMPAAGIINTGVIPTTPGITLTLVDGQMNSRKNVVSGVYRRSDGNEGLPTLIT